MNTELFRNRTFLLLFLFFSVVGIVLLGSTLLCNYIDSYANGLLGNSCAILLDITYYYTLPTHVFNNMTDNQFNSQVVFFFMIVLLLGALSIFVLFSRRNKFQNTLLSNVSIVLLALIVVCILLFVYVWDSQIPQKQYFDQKITNNSQYCIGRIDTPQCSCQIGYDKVAWTRKNALRYNCIPEVCEKISGLSGDDHTSLYNIDMCEWMARDKTPSPCYSIRYIGGRDLCILNYVGMSNDTSVCDDIIARYTRNECYG